MIALKNYSFFLPFPFGGYKSKGLALKITPARGFGTERKPISQTIAICILQSFVVEIDNPEAMWQRGYTYEMLGKQLPIDSANNRMISYRRPNGTDW